MRKVGRIFSMNVSLRMLFYFGLFSLVFTVVSVIAINRFFDISYENMALRQKVARMTRTLDERRYQSQVLRQYHQLVMELNKADLRKQGQEAPPEEPSAPATPRTQPEPDKAPQPEPGTTPPPEASAPIEAVDLSVNPESNDTAIRFQFHLRNIHPENKTVTGYLIVVLTNPNTTPPEMAAYPGVNLNEELQANYKKGTLFSIRHGKMVKGRVSNLTNAKDFTQAWVYVFSEKGEPLYKSLLETHDG